MTPYYADESVTLYHGDCREVLELGDRSVDCVITDPPYDERTHNMARSGNLHAPAGGRALSGSKAHFRAFTHEEQVATFAWLGRLTRRWVISSLASTTAFRFELDPPDGLTCLRLAVWVKTNPMPIFSGDRPDQVVLVHRAMYEIFVGPIPDRYEIDHLCRNPLCASPAHLEAVTKSENLRRQHAAATRCVNGHDISDPANLDTAKLPRRHCLVCKTNRRDAFNERRRAARRASA